MKRAVRLFQIGNKIHGKNILDKQQKYKSGVIEWLGIVKESRLARENGNSNPER